MCLSWPTLGGQFKAKLHTNGHTFSATTLVNPLFLISKRSRSLFEGFHLKNVLETLNLALFCRHPSRPVSQALTSVNRRASCVLNYALFKRITLSAYLLMFNRERGCGVNCGLLVVDSGRFDWPHETDAPRLFLSQPSLSPTPLPPHPITRSVQRLSKSAFNSYINMSLPAGWQQVKYRMPGRVRLSR